MDAPPVQYVRTPDGFDIAYAVSGEGRPLVLMPTPINHIGIEWGSATYGPFLVAMSRHFRLIRYDNRGSGMSTRGLPEDFSMLDYATDLGCVLDALGLERAVLIGRTTSGNVAVKYALAHPERVEALVLWNTGRHFRDSTAFSLLELSRTHWEYFLEVMARGSFPLDDATEAREMVRLAMDRSEFTIRVQAAARISIEEDATKLRLPVLLLVERLATTRLVSEAQKLAALIPDAQLRIFDRGATTAKAAGEDPPVVGAIAAFLASLEGEGLGSPQAIPGLSGREMEILRLVAAGRRNQEIADELVISLNTVRRHVSNIFDKTGVTNRAQAAVYAKEHGIA
jgi:pimeloyl-ACP methyl ester carboxylesterase/DNA-binding CsgD family transcriptional regulator